MHPLELALGLRLPMTKFIHSVLIFYGVAPSQLSLAAWRTVLRFETLCDLYAPEACHCDVCSVAYLLRKTTIGARYFIPQSRVENIIVNMVDSDRSMRNTMPWSARTNGCRSIEPALSASSGRNSGITA